MKRVMTVKANGGDVCTSVRIEVKSQNQALTEYEIETAVASIGDEVMRAVAAARYVGTPLTSQRVTRG